MSWLILFLAGLLEVAWAVGLKFVDGAKGPWILIGTIISLVLSTGLLAVAMKEMPLGTAYAVWTGIGAVGTFLVGVALFHEPMSAARVVCILLITVGVFGLKMNS